MKLPDGQRIEVPAGAHEWVVVDSPRPAPGPVTCSTSPASIMDDQEAYQTILEAFRRVDPTIAGSFTRSLAWVPNQPLQGAVSIIAPVVAAEVETSLAALNATRRA